MASTRTTLCLSSYLMVADALLSLTRPFISWRKQEEREDRAGGLVWRWKDGDNYYVARANALENNVSLYHTEHGRRMTIKYVDAPVASAQWHLLRVEFVGPHVEVILDGKAYIDVDDSHIAGPGRVGVWTKADSVTAFDDFSFGELTRSAEPAPRLLKSTPMDTRSYYAYSCRLPWQRNSSLCRRWGSSSALSSNTCGCTVKRM